MIAVSFNPHLFSDSNCSKPSIHCNFFFFFFKKFLEKDDELNGFCSFWPGFAIFLWDFSSGILNKIWTM